MLEFRSSQNFKVWKFQLKYSYSSLKIGYFSALIYQSGEVLTTMITAFKPYDPKNFILILYNNFSYLNDCKTALTFFQGSTVKYLWSLVGTVLWFPALNQLKKLGKPLLFIFILITCSRDPNYQNIWRSPGIFFFQLLKTRFNWEIFCWLRNLFSHQKVNIKKLTADI